MFIFRGVFRILGAIVKVWYEEECCRFSVVGGATMVGADAPEKILKIDPSRLPKSKSFLKIFLKQYDVNKAIFYYHESAYLSV